MGWSTKKLKLLLVRPGTSDTLDLSQLIESIEWSGSKWGAPRTLTATILDTTQRWQNAQVKPIIHDDNQVVFYYNDEELFRGKIFSKQQTKPGKTTIKAYDSLVYLTKNQDHYVFSKQKASDIIKRLCNDFQISVGSIVDTVHVIPHLVLSGRSLYDMIMKAIKITYDNTGVRHHLRAVNGNVTLVRSKDMAVEWIIEPGTNLINWTYTRSMENMITKIKLESHDLSQSSGNKSDSSIQTITQYNTGTVFTAPVTSGAKTIQEYNSMGGIDAIQSSKSTTSHTITAIATNDQLMKQFGILQHYEKSTNNDNQGLLQDKAKQMIQNMAKIEQTFDIESLGIPGVISGGAVQVIVPEVNIKKAYYIITDKHTFESNSHKMTLTLQDTDELPNIDSSDDSTLDVANDPTAPAVDNSLPIPAGHPAFEGLVP